MGFRVDGLGVRPSSVGTSECLRRRKMGMLGSMGQLAANHPRSNHRQKMKTDKHLGPMTCAHLWDLETPWVAPCPAKPHLFIGPW